MPESIIGQVPAEKAYDPFRDYGISEIKTGRTMDGQDMQAGDYAAAGISLLPGEVLIVVAGKLLKVRPLGQVAKDGLRAAAREIWQQRTGRAAIWDGLEVHHRIPLEWAHLFPDADPNRIDNLFGMVSGDHTQVTVAWNTWRLSLDGRTPTRAEVIAQAARIDKQFGHMMRALK